MRYKYGNKEVEIVDVEELKGKVVTVHEPKKFKYPEPFHCKFTLVGSNPEYSMFLTFYEAFEDKKFIFIEYLIRYIDKNNIVDVDIDKILSHLNIGKSTIYKWINGLIKSNFMIKISKNRFMINPNIVINYRRTKNKRFHEIQERYALYKSKLMKGS
jgi:hypothetical protein